MPFQFKPLQLPEVIAIQPEVFVDTRGCFFETYKESEFCRNGIVERFVQGNQSYSVQKTLRGIHYQKPPYAQGKLVRVVEGEIFDVVVDLRKWSPRYGRWVATTLSSENHTMIYVPVGFGHGAFVVSSSATLLYMVTREYNPASERGIIWSDPTLAIRWPTVDPILSARDQLWPNLRDAENDFNNETLAPTESPS